MSRRRAGIRRLDRGGGAAEGDEMKTETPVGRLVGVLWWCVVLSCAVVRGEEAPAIKDWRDALAWCEAGKLEEGGAWMLAQESPPPSGATGFEATRMLIYAGKPVEALRFAERLAKVYTKDPDARMAVALAWVKIGAPDQAKQAVRAVLAAKDKRAYATYLALRLAFFVGNDHSDKAGLVRSLLIEDERYPEFLVLAIEWAERVKDEAAVKQWRERFVALAPAYNKAAVDEAKANLAAKARFPKKTERESDERVEWKFESDWLPVVKLSVNGAPPELFIVDTGATHIFVDREWAKGVGLPTGVTIPQVNTATGRTSLELTEAGEVSGPGLKLRNVAILLGDFGPLRAAADEAPAGTFSDEQRALIRNFKGLVSAAELAGEGVVWFDRAGQRLVVAKNAEGLAPGRRFWRGFFKGSALASVPVSKEGSSALFMRWVTSATDVLSLSPEAVGLWAMRAESVEKTKSVGLAGEVVRDDGITKPFRLLLWGPRGPTGINFNGARVGGGRDDDFHVAMNAGQLGWPVLGRLSPAFDYGKRDVLLPVGAGGGADGADGTNPEPKAQETGKEE